ncbi:MAG: SulP family inorganic anion transporter, partial [Rhodoblastus sp.]
MAPSFATHSAQAKLASIFPFLRWAPLVNGRTMRADLLAGLTGAIVVLPQAVAFATIAGLPPQYGLYASIVPTIVAALFGSSWHLVAGPSTTASLVLAASLSAFAAPGTPDYVQFAMTLAIMTGLIELALGLFKLGIIVNFISHSVVIAYTAGVGMLIIATQAPHLFGLTVPSSHDFLIAIRQTIDALPTISPVETVVAFSTLGAGVAARKYLPRIPYMLPALLAGGLVAAAFNAWRPGAAAVV